MIVIGSVIASGTIPSAGGGDHSPSFSSNSLRRADDRRPVAGAGWPAARRPRQRQLIQRRRDLVSRQLEDVLGVLEEPACGEQRPNSRTLFHQLVRNQ